MIADFIASWPLFGESYLAGWGIAVMLSLAGVWVVARDQIFLGAAVAQASTLGTALALWLQGVVLSHAFASDLLTFGFAVVASVATALLTTRESRIGGESPEAITGWVFLLGTSLPVLMLAHSPHGLEEVHRIVLSSILGASRIDVWIFLVGSLISIAGLALLRDRIVLFAIDPEMAAAVGMKPGRWRVGIAVWLGTAVGLSIHSAGMIYTFGCLVLPAMIARSLCREIRPMFWMAPIVALVIAVMAFVIAHRVDLPPGQLTVALLCAAQLLGWLARRARQARSTG